MIPQHQLEGVRPRLEIEGHFGLPTAEMPVVVALRHRQIRRREIRVDHEMVMTRVLLLDARRRICLCRRATTTGISAVGRPK